MKRISYAGTSLVETLVSIALLGGIMIPLLFVSSANFLGQLASLRENADAYQSTSYFLNRFIDTLQSAKRVLPESTSSEIYLAYFDPILDREMKVGYKIEDMGSYRILHEMVYNPATLQWTETSPYPLMESDEIRLPDTVAFAYCLDNTCSGTTDVETEPERSALVQLIGWTFTSGEQVATLPDIDVFTGTDPGGGNTAGTILSDGVRELYSFHNNTSFGNGADLTRVNLTPDGSKFTYGALTGAVGPAGLTTILDTGYNLGYSASALGSQSTGQVFFAYSGTTNNRGVYSWNKVDGLSTIVTNGVDYKGMNSMAVDSDDRVYWGVGRDNEYSVWDTWPQGRLWTWHKDTGLATITSSNKEGPGWGSICTAGNRVFFSDYGTQSNNYTWSAATGLETISNLDEHGVSNYWTTNGLAKDNCNAGGLYVLSRFDFGNASSYTYAGGEVDIIFPGGVNSPGQYGSIKVSESGRVFIGDDRSDEAGNMYAWTAGGGLVKLTSNNLNYAGQHSIALSDNDVVFFGEYDDSDSGFWTWNPTDGLTPIFNPATSSISDAGYKSTAATPDGRVYFGNGEDEGDASVWTWKADTGLSTILDEVGIGHSEEALVAAANGRAYFGDNEGRYWTYHPDSGLSTLLTGQDDPGDHYAAVVDDATGRVFVGEDGDPGSLWTYHPDTGLSTIANNFNYPGYYNMLYNGSRLFFGDDEGYYTYSLGESSSSGDVNAGRFANTGTLTGDSVTFELTGANYGALYQDVYGKFYVVDEDNDNLDCFVYNSSDNKYERTIQKPLGAWASSVTAMAIDQASDGVALLVTGSDTVYTYADRNVDSGAATARDISGVADTPTGIAVSGRTGNWLIIDSDVTGSGANKIIRLHVFNNNWTYKKSIDIKVNDPAYLSVDASSETNFKIQYDDESNILYLLAPSLQRTFALALPEKV